jgi:hypothetical protein
VKLLAPHLTPDNHVELMERARHQSKRAIEALLADRAPKPDAASLVRRLPQSKPTADAPIAPTDSASSRPVAEPARAAGSGTTAPLRAAPIPPASVTRPPSPAPQPLGQERFKIQFTASRALCQKLREAQALLRHQVPSGDLNKTSVSRHRDTFRRRSSGQWQHEIGAAVRSWPGAGAAADRATSSSSTTRSPGPGRGATRSRTSSSAAAHTTTTRRCRTTGRHTWSAAGGAVARTPKRQLAPGRVSTGASDDPRLPGGIPCCCALARSDACLRIAPWSTRSPA